MRKKLFTFLLALAASVGMSWATVITWNASKLSSMSIDISSGSDSETSDGITVTAVSNGERIIVFGGNQVDIQIGNGEDNAGGYLTFTSSVGNIAQIDINHSGAGEWRNANGDWISPYYENFEGGIFTWSGTPAASITLTGDAPMHIDAITSIEFTIEDGGGSEPATGLQVVEVTSELYDGWNSNSNPFSVNALPGFQAVTFDEAKEWTGVPTSGTAVLVYRTNGDNARVIQFFDGTIMDDYDVETDFNQIYENITISGNRIFYTTGGGSTQATGLQVIELQVPGSWEGDNTLVTVSDLPGFVVFTLEEAGTWAAPEGNVNLIYMSKNNEGVRATSFFDGVWGQEYVAGFTRSVVFGWASNGNRIFYTTDGSELTPKPSWVRDGDDWDDATKTLTVNSNPGTGAYASQSEIENLIISDAVTSIGQAAFAGCSNISYVTCGNNIQTIGVGAFTMCGFTYIELPASVTTIGNSAFYSCSNLSSVTIGNNVASIGDHAFDACVSLTEITIPASVTTIGVDAFYNCTGMTDVYCYPNAADLTWNEDGCDDFRSGNATQCHVNADQLDAYQTKFNGVVRVTFVGDLPAPTPAGLQVTELQIPDSWQNDNTKVTISDLPGFVAVSLEEAEAWTAPEGDVILIYTGKNDEGVTAIDFNNGVLVGMGPFGGFSRADIFDWGYKIFYTSGGSTPAVDPAVQNVIDLINAIPNQVAYNDECKNAIDAARAAYDALTDAQKTLVENYGALLDAETAYAQLTPNPSGECGAQGDNLLWELNTSTGVLTITGSGAMYDWAYDTDLPWYDNRLQITSVVLPSGITSIGTKAFRGCQNLASINMTENYPAGLIVINQEAFCHTKLTSIIIPESVVTIGQDAFYRSEDITDVYCYADPNNLTWTDFWGDDFKNAKSTQCHVKDCYLDVYNSKWNTGTTSTDVNVTFVGDLPGDCGGSTPTPSGDNKLPGAFSVDGSTVVYFSKGNLQATTNDLGANWTWAFAANQYDYINNAAAISGNGTVSTNGTIDLFGWSTSSTFYGIHNSTDNGTYSGNFVDWSSNTALIASLGGDWRTLTSSEWGYLLDWRTTTSGVRYAKATVNGVAGLIILPDNWDVAYHALASTNDPDADFNGNIINSAEWTNELEAHGAVFLPAAGNRNGTNVNNAGSDGYYWSAISEDGYTANYMYFNDSELSANSFNTRHYGRSVRLVSETAPAPAAPTDEQVPTNEDPQNPSYHYSTFFHSTQNYKLTNDGTQAFIADLSGSDLVLTKIAEGTQVIPANTAVIFRKSGSADPVVLTPTEENGVSVNPDDNSLKGVDAVTTLESLSIAQENCYVLSGTNDYGVGFYQINSTSLKAHKAYVIYSGNAAPRRMRFVFNQTTDVESIQPSAVSIQKILENGQVIIIRNGVRYNAAGQIVK